MVEQLPFKQLVRGSSPRRPTTDTNRKADEMSFADFLCPLEIRTGIEAGNCR